MGRMSESTRITADSAALLISGYLGLLLFGVAGLFVGSAFGLCLQSLLKNLNICLSPMPRSRDDGLNAMGVRADSSATKTRFAGDCYDTKNLKAAANALGSAYQYLGAERTDSDDEIKRKVKKLISIHHPDKLHSAAQSKESVAQATEKVQKIIRAYDRVKRSRGSRDCSQY